MKKTIFTLLLAVVGCTLASSVSAVETIDIYRVPNAAAPKVDGVTTDWSTLQWTNATKIKSGNTTSECLVKFKAKYTNDSLYVIVDVTDPTPHNETAISNVYERDCVELFISMDTTTVTGLGGDFQYRLQRDNSQLDMGTVVANAKSYEVGATGYLQEWAMSWVDICTRRSLPTDVPLDGAGGRGVIKFEIQAADNNTGAAGRAEQVFWNAGTDDQYSATTNYGLMYLKGLVNGVANVALNPVNVHYNATQDALTVSNYAGDINVYNAIGKLVLSTNVKSSNQSISLNSINKGVYVVKCGLGSAKFVK